MNTIIAFIFQVILIAIFGYVYYKMGYSKREQEFQSKAIQFTVGGGYPVLKVSHGDNGVDVKIYDKKFVNIID